MPAATIERQELEHVVALLRKASVLIRDHAKRVQVEHDGAWGDGESFAFDLSEAAQEISDKITHAGR